MASVVPVINRASLGTLASFPSHSYGLGMMLLSTRRRRMVGMITN